MLHRWHGKRFPKTNISIDAATTTTFGGRVPIESRVVIGKEFLIASLKTGDFKEAARLATYVNKDHQTLLDDAVSRPFPTENNRKLDDIPTGEIEQMVHAWFADSNRISSSFRLRKFVPLRFCRAT